MDQDRCMKLIGHLSRIARMRIKKGHFLNTKITYDKSFFSEKREILNIYIYIYINISEIQHT